MIVHHVWIFSRPCSLLRALLRASARGTRPYLIGSAFLPCVADASDLHTASSGAVFSLSHHLERFTLLLSSNLKLLLPSPSCGPGCHLRIFLFRPVILQDFWKCRQVLRIFFFGRSLIEAFCARDHKLLHDFWQVTQEWNRIDPAPCPCASLNLYQTRSYSFQSIHFHQSVSFLAAL